MAYYVSRVSNVTNWCKENVECDESTSNDVEDDILSECNDGENDLSGANEDAAIDHDACKKN